MRRPVPFPWREIMGFALGVLRLSPAVFWSMSPRELECVLGALPAGTMAAPARADLADLMQRFPDRHDGGA
ncbi:rcc01693 family protein [Nitratireductor soli]|uniref:rcc01693 family protein n=1 Tax=Nitratireductor soli TaxID=1670619 RepID=UPI00244EBC97|nr:rcc01693 family protein [Nitratireductor soli]